MTEKAPMGDMRPKLKEVALPLDTVKELADLIPKQENQYHYRITGDWKENSEVFRVAEGDGVISDYTFSEKSDMSLVQFASRKTYTKEMDMWGKLKEKPVQFDRKTSTWKKLNLFQSIKAAFHKETNIPSQVVTEPVNGKEVAVLHTMEQKRPVGVAVQEVELRTLQDAKVDLGLKYKHIEHRMNELFAQNASLQTALSYAQQEVYTLNREISRLQRDQTQASYEQEKRMTMEAKNRMVNENKMTEQRIAEAKQKAVDAKLDAEYTDWVSHLPDKAYYENSGNPLPSKADYVEMKVKQAASKQAARDAEERGLAKD